MHHYTGDAGYHRMATHTMRYLVGLSKADPEQLRAETLLADRELSAAPIHITIVGAKSDSAARDLHAAALRYPSDYLQIDWWDRDEGQLPNPEIRYPQLDRAAAFACTASACSMSVSTRMKLRQLCAPRWFLKIRQATQSERWARSSAHLADPVPEIGNSGSNA
jgi:uncharacterized protein YyaL (SSP411 family)